MLSDLPRDPNMLVSYLNTLLRDYYSSLDELCEEKDISAEELNCLLKDIRCRYDCETNSIRPV